LGARPALTRTSAASSRSVRGRPPLGSRPAS
jgi:hypothetical protein